MIYRKSRSLKLFFILGIIINLSGCDSFAQFEKKQELIEAENRKLELETKANKMELAWVTEFCTTESAGGEIQGLQGSLHLEKEKIKNISAGADASKYTKAAQQIENLTAEADRLHRREETACRSYALCLYRKATDGVCSDAVDTYKATQSRIDDLALKIRSLSSTKLQ